MPPRTPAAPPVQCTVILTQAHVKALDAVAVAQNVSRSQIVREAVSQFLSRLDAGGDQEGVARSMAAPGS